MRFRALSFLVLIIGLQFWPQNIHAAEPTEIPTPTPTAAPASTPAPTIVPPTQDFSRFQYPCTDVANPEYNPSRPYPGSPCDTLIPKSWPEKERVSFACGKSLNVGDTISLARNYPTGGDLPSNPVAGTVYWCDASHTQACIVKEFNYNVNIDLSGATIPILGNTQDNLDDATRVNQYLMSYLGGTVQQADQQPIDKNDPSAIDRLINFAGPLKKLLSFDSQNKIKSDLATGPIGTQYHNYIAGCQKGVGLQYFIDLFTTFFRNVGINIVQFPGFVITSGKVVLGAADLVLNHPVVATNLGNAMRSAVATDVVSAFAYYQTAVADIPPAFLRDLSDLYQYPVGYMTRLGEIVQTVSTDQAVLCSTADAATKRLTDLQLPPKPNDAQFNGDFNRYWDAYKAWHQGFGSSFWLGTSYSSVWASLFQNVPFTTLEDTVGEFTVSVINKAGQQPEGVITGNPNKPIKLTITSGDARIAVPHVRAIDALASLLQSISAPKDHTSGFNQSGQISSHQEVGDGPAGQPELTLKNIGPGNSSVVPGKDAPFPLFTSHDSICDLKDIRINGGDFLYGQNVSAKLTYYQKFEYTPVNPVPPNPGGQPPNTRCTASAQCQSNNCLPPNLNGERYCSNLDDGGITQDTEARVAVFSKIPLIDQIYDKLVVGSWSILRRFIPHAPEGVRPQDYLREGGSTFPAAIGASYTGDGRVTAGDKTGGGQIYIPRLGSLFDYFLGAANNNLNLQKALRPQGFGGNGIGGLTSTPGGVCNVPQSGLCSLNDPQTQLQSNFPTSANTAAMICDRESNGDTSALNDGCLENPVWNTRIHSADYSVGLFQINMLSHPSPAFLNIPEGASLKAAIAAIGRGGKTCYEAFSNWRDYQDTANYGNYCVVADRTLLNTCVQWFSNPANTIAYVKNMSGNGTNWGPWSTYTNTLQCQPAP